MHTIIIGAGLAGLTAAEHLIRAGRSVTVLEARHRAGGRLWTTHVGGLAVEMGPEWVAASGAMHQRLKRAHARVTEASGPRYRRNGDRWDNLDEMPDEVDALVDRMKTLAGPDRSVAEALAECCTDARFAHARSMLVPFVEGFHASEIGKLSTRWLAEVQEKQPAEASSLRAIDGLDRALGADTTAVLEGGRMLFDTVVTEVQWRKRHAIVLARGPHGISFDADSVIVTVPLPLLFDAPGVQFTPDLPAKREAASRLEMGHVLKLVIEFREAFWREIHPLKGMLFLQAFDQPFPTWWTAEGDAPVLTAWAGGAQALRLRPRKPGGSGHDVTSPIGEDALLDAAFSSLAHALDRSKREITSQLVRCVFHDWSSDPWARGAYTYVGVGGIDAHVELARPVDGTLFFAGEATMGDGLNATMDGAVLSGIRAATEVLESERRT